ncbi:MAG: transposase [Magnetococcales bacterium]|nr:transposase [Magnetococcales bacterium]
MQPEDNKSPTEQRTKNRVCRLRLLADFLPKPGSRPFYLLATDATPHPRPFARTLEDRHIVYMPNPAPGNKPIGVGHKYSMIAILPEKNSPSAHPWAIPLSIEQIPSHDTDNLVASRQIRSLLTDSDLPFQSNLTVNVADSLYCAVPFLGSVGDIDNLITVVRSPGNRVFYFQPAISEQKKRGHPIWLGKRFDMKDPETWGIPTQSCKHAISMASGKTAILELDIWDGLLMKGNRSIPMNKSPFTLIHCRLLNADGSHVFTRPLWLIVFGKRRKELSPVVVWQSYRQRYDIEHFFRFGKSHLLMGRYQTPVVEHEENWLDIVGLTYFQLWIASPLAQTLPRPWERYSIPKDDSNPPGPSMTQKDFERIIRQIEKSPSSPKPRGKSPGRQPGYSPGQRSKRDVVFKGRKQTKKKAA